MKDSYPNEDTPVIKSKDLHSGKSTPAEELLTPLEPNLELSDLDCSKRSNEVHDNADETVQVTTKDGSEEDFVKTKKIDVDVRHNKSAKKFTTKDEDNALKMISHAIRDNVKSSQSAKSEDEYDVFGRFVALEIKSVKDLTKRDFIKQIGRASCRERV